TLVLQALGNTQAVSNARQEAADIRRAGMKAEAEQEKNERRGRKRTANEAGLESDDDDDKHDEVRLWEDGFKERYYESKFEVSADNLEFRYRVALQYVRGLCWVLRYYYQGCASWKWYFPYHYAPFASDFVNICGLETKFETGTQPFRPLEQLMGVFPAASSQHVPQPWAKLMSDPFSPIIDFYPTDFKIDLNGKRHWSRTTRNSSKPKSSATFAGFDRLYVAPGQQQLCRPGGAVRGRGPRGAAAHRQRPALRVPQRRRARQRAAQRRPRACARGECQGGRAGARGECPGGRVEARGRAREAAPGRGGSARESRAGAKESAREGRVGARGVPGRPCRGEGGVREVALGRGEVPGRPRLGEGRVAREAAPERGGVSGGPRRGEGGVRVAALGRGGSARKATPGRGESAREAAPERGGSVRGAAPGRGGCQGGPRRGEGGVPGRPRRGEGGVSGRSRWGEGECQGGCAETRGIAREAAQGRGGECQGGPRRGEGECQGRVAVGRGGVSGRLRRGEGECQGGRAGARGECQGGRAGGEGGVSGRPRWGEGQCQGGRAGARGECHRFIFSKINSLRQLASPVVGLKPVLGNTVVCVRFEDPQYPRGLHLPPREGWQHAKDPPRVLRASDFNNKQGQKPQFVAADW
ncbi:hypothetical protein ACJJTC_006799, partial [Scirpophaga incertulas]